MRRKNEERRRGVRYTEDSCRAAANLLIYGIFTYYNEDFGAKNAGGFSELISRCDALEELFGEINGASGASRAFRRFIRSADRAFGRGCGRENASDELTERLNDIFDELLEAFDCDDEDGFEPDADDGDTEDYDDFFFGPDGKLPF